MVTPEKTPRIRSAAWVFTAIAVGIASWASGVYTEYLLITGCSWLESHATFVYFLGAPLLVVAFYSLHRLPFFDRETASRRSRVLGALLFFPWGFGLLVSGPNSLGAISRGQQKRTMADIRKYAGALGSYQRVHGSYPVTSDPEEFRTLLGDHVTLPPRDGWGNPWVVQVTSVSYTIVSYGKCGRPDSPTLAQYESGITSSYQSDIVYSDGEFVQMPEGIQAN